MELLVGMKWSALRTEVDALTGTAHVVSGRFGPDPASLVALSWALLLAHGVAATVTAVTVGGEAAEEVLRIALSLGADRVHRVVGPELRAEPHDVARAIAPFAQDADLALLGAWSIDGRSASVAPTLAALLDRPQACGLLTACWDDGRLVAERRLPVGRRERIRLELPAVVSMEAGTISVGRAPLTGVLAAAGREIPVTVPEVPIRERPVGASAAYRPRPRTVPKAPVGNEPRDRIAALTGLLESGSAAQQLELEPAAAAAEILSALRRWGYLRAD